MGSLAHGAFIGHIFFDEIGGSGSHTLHREHVYCSEAEHGIPNDGLMEDSGLYVMDKSYKRKRTVERAYAKVIQRRNSISHR